MKQTYFLPIILVLQCSVSLLFGHNLPIKGDLTDETLSISTKKGPSQDQIQKILTKGWVSYSDFGAIGDGKSDDIEEIVAAHAFANQHNLSVKADDNATYYIGGKKLTAD